MRCPLLVLVVVFLTLAQSQLNNGTQEEETGLIVSSGLVKRSSGIRTLTRRRRNRREHKIEKHKKKTKQFGSCDYVRLSGLNQCQNGEQALLNSKLLFLMVENIEIATFSKNAKQFMQCTTVIDKTTELKCKNSRLDGTVPYNVCLFS